MIPIEKLNKILFLDIETVPQYSDYDLLNEKLKKLWDRKARHITKKDQTPKNVYQSAGIYAEFGKIICISVGYHTFEKEKEEFRIKSFSGDDEHKLLSEFAHLINSKLTSDWLLCAHNGKEFDFPYIARRMLINDILLPKIFRLAGKKPWEIPHLDTLELWKFGDYKHYTSIDLLTTIFNIPTPKDDISGADVFKVYYIEHNLNRIVKYCEKDVIAVAQLLRRFIGKAILTNDQIIIKNNK